MSFFLFQNIQFVGKDWLVKLVGVMSLFLGQGVGIVNGYVVKIIQFEREGINIREGRGRGIFFRIYGRSGG